MLNYKPICQRDEGREKRKSHEKMENINKDNKCLIKKPIIMRHIWHTM